MKIPALLAAAALIGLAVFPVCADTESPVRAARIDPAKTWGTWEGWGASLAWWAKVFGDRDDLADLFFTTRTVELGGQKLPGLGMNIVRYNAGACSGNEIDGRRMVVSKIIKPYRQIEGFWLDGKNADPASQSWDWSVDANQRAMLLKARDRGADRFELFSNSPMWWMCANDNPSGAATATDDNLAPEHHQNFAIYLATIARRAKEHWGIGFTTVEPFNEPVSKWWFADCKQEGCHFSPVAQAAVLKHLRAELDLRGLRDLPIAASDENTYDEAVATWHAFDAPIRALVAQINVHGYQGKKGRRDLVHQAAVADGKRLWNSEYGEHDATGLELAQCLHLDLQHLHPAAWCYWQPLDGGGWGLLAADLEKKTFGAANPKFFVLAHYTRHIRPGMTLIESGAADTVAAYDAAERKLVLVVFNPGAARDWSGDLSRFGTVGGPVATWLTEPKGAARYERRDGARLSGRTLGCLLPAGSVVTLEVMGVAL